MSEKKYSLFSEDNSDDEDNNEEDNNWESELDSLRQSRKFKVDNTLSNKQQKIDLGDLPIEKEKKLEREEDKKLDKETQRKIYSQYLNKWQKEHNNHLTKKQKEHPNVIIKEELNDKYEELIKEGDYINFEEEKVYFNPKTRDIHFKEERSTVATEGNIQGSLFENEETRGSSEVIDADCVPITVKIFKPKLDSKQAIQIVSEKELINSLLEKMVPQLNHILSSNVKVIIQQYNNSFVQNIFSKLNEEIPDLICEVLKSNLEDILKEIKYKK